MWLGYNSSRIRLRVFLLASKDPDILITSVTTQSYAPKSSRSLTRQTVVFGGTVAAPSAFQFHVERVRSKPGTRDQSQPPLLAATSDSLEASFFFAIAGNAAPVDRLQVPQGPRPFDWDRLLAFAMLENSVTVLDDRLSKLPSDAIPGETRERMGRLALVWTLKLKLLERRLYESVRVLADAGIEVTLLKGAGIALTAYRRFEDRPMADIDLLVHPSRAQDAHRLMQQHGWKPDIAGHPADAWDTHHHLTPLLDGSGSGLRLELHVGAIPPGHPFQLDLTEMGNNSIPLDLEGVRVMVLEPHFHAVHAAIHFAWCHQFATGGTNICRDLAAITTRPDFSWERFVALARETRSQTSCYWTLRLARGLADLAVPDGVLAVLAPEMSDALLGVLERHLAQLVLRSDRACPSTILRHRLWAFALQTERARTDEATHWDAGIRDMPSRTSMLRRVPSHMRRLRAWALYLMSMTATLLG